MSNIVFKETLHVVSVINTLLIALVSIGLLWYLQFRWGRINLYRLAAKVPHVNCRSWPLIGIAHIFIGKVEGMLDVIVGLSSQKTTTKFWIGPQLTFILCKPEDIEIVLNSRTALAKHYLYNMLKTFSGEGLFTGIVPTWKVHRKLIQPTFNQAILNDFVDNFVIQAEVFVSVLRKDVGKLIDIEHKLANWGMDSICESAIGVQINAQTTDSLLAKTLSRGWSILMSRMMTAYYHSDILFRNTGLYKEGLAIKKVVNDFIDNVLKEKQILHKENKRNQLDTIHTDDKKFKTFLDLFVELKYEKGKLTNEELQDETINIFIGGSDTSKQTVGFILQMLGMFPEVQQKVYEEIIDVIGINRKLQYTDLPKLIYIERVIKETMRLYPIAPFMARQLGADLDISEYTLPKDAGVIISPIVLHRSPLYWKDPLKFDPDRFLPEEVAKRHPYTYIPFSAGPRNCIGHKYAMMSMKTLIATVIKEYVFTSPYACVEDLKCDSDLLLKPVNGFPISFVSRS